MEFQINLHHIINIPSILELIFNIFQTFMVTYSYAGKVFIVTNMREKLGTLSDFGTHSAVSILRKYQVLNII